MTLCIDIGNTFAKLAVFGLSDEGEAEKMYFFAKRKDISNVLIEEMCKKYVISDGILSSTRKKNNSLIGLLSKKLNLLVLNGETPLPIENSYVTPKTLGKDRLAAVVGACKLYPNQNTIVFTAGTCLTSNFITSENRFLGGNISPGISMRLKSMHHFTANIPLAKLDYNGGLLGKSTEEALQNGAVLGAICEFEAFIERILVKYGKSNIILTGGDTFYFEESSKYKIFAHPNLVLRGLNEILKFNA